MMHCSRFVSRLPSRKCTDHGLTGIPGALLKMNDWWPRTRAESVAVFNGPELCVSFMMKPWAKAKRLEIQGPVRPPSEDAIFSTVATLPQPIIEADRMGYN
jgi:hypothetical protein